MKSVRGFSHIYKRGDNYLYRRGVPIDVRPKLEKSENGGLRTEWIHSLKTTRLDIAERNAVPLAAQHDRIIADIRSGKDAIETEARETMAKGEVEVFDYLRFVAEHFGQRDQWPDHVRAVADIMQNGGPSQPMPLSDIYEIDKARHAEAGGSRSEKPIVEAVNDFLTVVGDLDILKITYADADAWISAMRKGVTRKLGRDKKPMAQATIRRRVGALRAIIGRAYRLHSIERPNPFAGHKVGGAGRATDRLPLNTKMLDALRDYLATNKRVRNESRRILQIMMATGADVGEIGGLARGDIVLDHKVPHLIIRPNKIRGLKAEARERRIPLVGEALVAAKEATKSIYKTSEQLFRGYDRDGRGADSLSGKLNKVIRAAGIPKSKRLTSKSLRHTMIEALRAAGSPEHVNRRIQGHSARDPHQRYGTPGERLSESKKWLEAAIEKLGDIDDAAFGDGERMKKSPGQRRSGC